MILKIKNGSVIIDNEDYKLIKDYNWYVGGGYAIAKTKVNGEWQNIKMHSIINKTPKGLDTDHINRNPLDNRKENLRSVTRSVNCQNTNKRLNTTSQYKGVTWKSTHSAWVAKITKNRTSYFLGHFTCEIEAAKAYDKKAIELFGSDAATNF